MLITALEEYGVRCAIQLARTYQCGLLPASQIAELEGISVEYASKILHLFKKSGIAVTARGTQGGFGLSRAPGDLTLNEVLNALRGKRRNTQDFCQNYKGLRAVCNHHESCSLRPVWKILSSTFNEILSSLTLAHLLVTEPESEKTIKTIATKKTQAFAQAFPQVSQ